jgi:hypothetical protein
MMRNGAARGAGAVGFERAGDKIEFFATPI